MTNESLTKAQHSAQSLLSDLQDAIPSLSAVECLILLPMIERAAILVHDVMKLRSARGDA